MNEEASENYLVDEWEFENKNYPHFDSFYCKNRTDQIIVDLKNNKKINHSFYPLIRFSIKKYTRDKKFRVITSETPRYIMHTARIDANIYKFYRKILSKKYEIFLKENTIDDCVIGYRKIKNSDGKNKCNIHFSNEAVDEILKKLSSVSTCVAITMDISGFFDSLDHQVLKKNWCRVMGFEKGMPADHFHIYKNASRYTYIDADVLYKTLGMKISKYKLCNKKQICTPLIFKEKIQCKLSQKNKKGIPQGLPISDVISNIYMIDFDILMKKFSIKYDAYYRRYSDDILFICQIEHEKKAVKFIKKILKRKCSTLLVKDNKTRISRFEVNKHNITCQSYDYSNTCVGKTFDYLGLSFDGKNKNICRRTISSFYRKLTSAIKEEINFSRWVLEKDYSFPTPKQIYNRINFKKIRNKYMKNRARNSEWKENRNFFSYVERFSKITSSFDAKNIYKDLSKKIKYKVKKRLKIV